MVEVWFYYFFLIIIITEFIFSSIKWILSYEGNCGNSLIIDSGFLTLGGFSASLFLRLLGEVPDFPDPSGPHAPRDLDGEASGPMEDGKAGAEIQGQTHFPSLQRGLFFFFFFSRLAVCGFSILFFIFN